MAFRGQDQFRTDPTGVLAQGAPSGGGGGGFPIGGISRPNIPSPVQSAGSMGPGPRVGGGVGVSIGSGPGGGKKLFAQRDENVALKAKGGKAKAKVRKMAKGGSVSSASKRADGRATKGKTKGRFV